MLSKHAAEVKKNIKTMSPNESRTFYCAADGDHLILHITEKKVSSSKFGDVTGLNAHYQRFKAAEGYQAFSAKTNLIAGKVTLVGEALIFVPKIKKGLSGEALAKALKGHKPLLKPYTFQVSASEGEQGTSSEGLVKETAGSLQRYHARLASPDALSETDLQTLLRELEGEAERGDDPRWGQLREQAQRLLDRQRLRREILAAQANIGTLDRGALRALHEKIVQYTDGAGGSASDLGGAVEQVAQRREVLKTQHRLEKLTSTLQGTRSEYQQVRGRLSRLTSDPETVPRKKLEHALLELQDLRQRLVQHQQALRSMAG